MGSVWPNVPAPPPVDVAITVLTINVANSVMQILSVPGDTSARAGHVFLVCLAGKCQDPYKLPTTGCASSAECRVSNHRPVCICPQGVKNNPKIDCNQDQDCEPAKSCRNNKCVNLCLLPTPVVLNPSARASTTRRNTPVLQFMLETQMLSVPWTRMNVSPALVDPMLSVNVECKGEIEAMQCSTNKP